MAQTDLKRSAAGRRLFPTYPGSNLLDEISRKLPEDASDPEPEAVVPTPSQPSVVAACLIALTILAVVYSLYFGRDFLMPIVMAAVLNLLLHPVMQFLNERLRLPLPVAALLVIALAFTVIAGVPYVIAPPSADWTANAAESIAIVKQRLAFLAGPITYLQDALHNIEGFGAAADTSRVVVERGDALPSILFYGTASTLRSFFLTILILYFMLASGDRMLRAIIEILPRFKDKRRAVEILAEIQASVGTYLTTIVIMNTIVGALVGVAAAICGLSNPALWGALAFFLNFIPIIGPLMGVAVLFVAGVVALAWPFPALAPALLYVLIHFAEGEFITPQLLARRFELNPVLVMVSLLFWDAIWGLPGALLAVPLLAILKIFADRIEPLKSLGHLIGA
jgi:predicted PurR-regulated permease PerM